MWVEVPDRRALDRPRVVARSITYCEELLLLGRTHRVVAIGLTQIRPAPGLAWTLVGAEPLHLSSHDLLARNRQRLEGDRYRRSHCLPRLRSDRVLHCGWVLHPGDGEPGALIESDDDDPAVGHVAERAQSCGKIRHATRTALDLHAGEVAPMRPHLLDEGEHSRRIPAHSHQPTARVRISHSRVRI